MRLATTTKYVTLLMLALNSVNAFAYDDEKEKERCRNPKVQEFTLPVYDESHKLEATPESEFSFVVSGWADPKKFQLFAKDKDVPFTVDSKETFHKIKAKLLPEFTGKFIRLNARIPALLGCYSTIGWLIKVADKPNEAAAPTAQPQPANLGENTDKNETAKPESASQTGLKSADEAGKQATAPGSSPAETGK